MANTPGEAHNLTSGYYTRYTYRLNTTADAIKRYVVLTNGSLQSQGVYEADQLTVYRTLNAQDGNSSQQQENLEYTDALGRTIASEVRVSDQDRRITYYVYDDLNRLRYILPPMADTYDCSTPKTAQQLGDYCYYSEYDERGNIIKSQNPGAEYSLAIYDRRGRLAMSQSGKQRINNEWSFTKYDVFDRPVLSGIITGGTYESHKAALDAATVFYEERGTTVHGYTNQSYPSVPNANSYLTVTYYDDYDWLAANDPHAFSTADALGQTHTTDVVGLTTGVKNKVLGISTDQWLTTVTYYDQKYQTIQAISDLYPSGTEITSNTHDFLGNVTQTKVKQSVGGSTYEYNKWFNYDNFGRLLSIQQQITGDATNGKVTLASYTYDNLGNVASKSIHNGAETETYTYDLNGRVIASTSPSFSYTLDYEQSDLPGATPRLDGQITALRWGAGQTPNRAYAYTYDPVGQLSAAAYKTATNGTWSASNAYAEKNLTYDRHGNIKTLQRTDANGSVLHELSDMTYTGNKLQSLKLNGGSPVNYAYDQNGNITSDGRRGVTINYNILNFPEQIIAGNQQVSYIYSAAGEKLATNANGSLTYYRSVMVYGNDNKLLYILTPEGTVSRTEGSAGTSYTYNYFKKDQIGSTRAVLSAVGNTLQNVQSTDYYPFGLAYSTNNLNKNKYLFSGKELQDASIGGTILGLYDFGARQYDPVIGRWLKQDRYACKYASISPYTYCANNPILFTDPTGDTLTAEQQFIDFMMNSFREVFGAKADRLYYDENGNLQLDGTAREFREGLTYDQQQAFNGLYDIMTRPNRVSVAYGDTYAFPSNNGKITDVVNAYGGGVYSTIDQIIVIAEHPTPIDVWMDMEPYIFVEVKQTRTSLLFHEIGEANMGASPIGVVYYRGDIITYENYVRRIINLPLRPTDMEHSKTIKSFIPK